MLIAVNGEPEVMDSSPQPTREALQHCEQSDLRGSGAELLNGLVITCRTEIAVSRDRRCCSPHLFPASQVRDSSSFLRHRQSLLCSCPAQWTDAERPPER